jgi:hypothetical protein
MSDTDLIITIVAVPGRLPGGRGGGAARLERLGWS